MTPPAWPSRGPNERRRGTTGGSDYESGERTGITVSPATAADAVVAGICSTDTCTTSNPPHPQRIRMRTMARRRRTKATQSHLCAPAVAFATASVSLAILLCSTPCCFGLPAAPTTTTPGANPRGLGILPFEAGSVGSDNGPGGKDSGVHQRHTQPRPEAGQLLARQQAIQQCWLKQRYGSAGGSRVGGTGLARRRVEAVGTAVRTGGALGVRGGARRSWFTGYEDTTQEEDSSEEGESTDYEGDSSNDVTTDDGAGDDAATEGELSGKEEVQKNQINPRKEQDDAKQGGGDKTGSQKADGGGKKDEENNAPASPDPRRQAFDDIYGRTIARRKATALVFRVLQRTLIKAAFLLIAFQIFPWLRNNFLVQWLLVGSLLLQTVTELVGIARAADAATKSGKGRGQTRPGDDSAKESGANTTPSSTSSPGVIGGLMKVLSLEDEHRQHLDFQRMNEMFDKDVEALATASRPKSDIPSMLMPTGSIGGSGLPVAAGLMMKAFKGLAGKHEDKKNSTKAGNGESKSRSSSPAGSNAARGKSGVGGRRKGRRHRRDRRMSGGTHSPHGDSAARGKQETEIPPVEEELNEGINKTDKGDVERSDTERFALQNVRYFDDGGGGTAAGKESGEGGVNRGGPAEGRGADGQAADADRNGGSAGGGVGEGASKNGTAVATPKPEKRVFVVKFRPGHGPEEGQEETMDLLSATVSFFIANGNNATDEVVVLLESGGGEVSTFGLAAAKLARLKDSGFNLTVCVDKIAASGGYMMACIADKLVVAPFAMLGSIGVVGGMPNFNKALKKFGVDYFHFTAGHQKSLIGPFQEVTKANQAMQQRQIDTIHSAFKEHVQRYRPSVDVEAVGTGEVWLGQQAVELRLADEVGTAMEYLQGRMSDSQVFLVKQHKKKMIGGGSSLLRALLLGPLAKAGGFGFRASTLFEVARMLLLRPPYAHGTGGGRDFYPGARNAHQPGPFDQQARPFPHLSRGVDGNFDEDSLTRALTKAMHAARAGGSAGSGGGGGGLDGVGREEGEGGGFPSLGGGSAAKFGATMQPGSCWDDMV